MKLIFIFSSCLSNLPVCSLFSNYLPCAYLFVHNCNPFWRLQFSNSRLSPLFLIKYTPINFYPHHQQTCTWTCNISFLIVWHGTLDRISRWVIEYSQEILSHMVHRPGAHCISSSVRIANSKPEWSQLLFRQRELVKSSCWIGLSTYTSSTWSVH